MESPSLASLSLGGWTSSSPQGEGQQTCFWNAPCLPSNSEVQSTGFLNNKDAICARPPNLQLNVTGKNKQNFGSQVQGVKIRITNEGQHKQPLGLNFVRPFDEYT